MLTLKEIERKLKNKHPPMTEGDHSLNAGMKPEGKLRKAAVLILLVEREDGIHILFTERTAHLSTHAGQISFPGGGAEPQDKDMAATALRESWEEIGLDPENVRIIGQLPAYITRSGFDVTAVVGVLERPQKWMPDENEVAAIFDTPLEHILKTGELREETVTFEGNERRFYALDWRRFRVWGATAGMLKNFADAISVKSTVNDAPQDIGPVIPDEPQ